MRTINIIINEQVQPSIKKIDLGQQYENNDLTLNFQFDESLKSLNKYAIFIHQVKSNPVETEPDRTLILPISNNTLKITNSITSLHGLWQIYFMFREHEIDTTQEQVDINAKSNERVAICELQGFVKASSFRPSEFENIQIDENIQVLYDDLLALQKQVTKTLNDLEEVATTSTEILKEANKYADDVSTSTHFYTLEEANKYTDDVAMSTYNVILEEIGSGKDARANFETWFKEYNVATIPSNKYKNSNVVVNGYFPNATVVEQGAFDNCISLVSIEMPNVPSITYYVFKGCASLTSVICPKVTTIRYGAFQNCTSLKTVKFDSVTSITGTSSNVGAFEGCTALTQITFKSTTMVTLEDVRAFKDTPNLKYIFVPSAIISQYRADEKWSAIGVTFDTVENTGWGPLV